jgi:hypothetical protein
MIDLKSLIPKEGAKLRALIEFREGIFLEMNYVSREELQTLGKEFSYLKYDPIKKARTQEINAQEFGKAFCAKAVTGWQGVTPKSFAAAFTPLDLSGLTEEQKNESIPFTVENLQQAVATSYELDKFIQDSASDPKLFSPTQEAELGNSETSQSGS